jgi:hypothetical protein
MCVQAIGLIAAEIERHGIPTISITLLKEVTAIIKPPRALFVPFKLGFPLGEPNNPELQNSVINAALALLQENNVPVLRDFIG